MAAVLMSSSDERNLLGRAMYTSGYIFFRLIEPHLRPCIMALENLFKESSIALAQGSHTSQRQRTRHTLVITTGCQTCETPIHILETFHLNY